MEAVIWTSCRTLIEISRGGGIGRHTVDRGKVAGPGGENHAGCKSLPTDVVYYDRRGFPISARWGVIGPVTPSARL